MRWQKELVGASLTLAATVIGGIILWAVTQGPTPEKKELLYFVLDRPVGFSGKEQRLSIGTFSFGNAGNVPAREVVATLTSSGARIIEANLGADSAPTQLQNLRNDGTKVSVSVPNMLPSDKVVVSYLLDRPGSVSLDVRSNQTKAKPVSAIAPMQPDSTRSRLNQVFERYWPILFLASFVPIWLFRKERKRSKRNRYYRPENRNNNAFVLMHTGYPQDAKRLLRDAIELGKDGSFAMSNYAGACALLGEMEEGRKFLAAAEFLAEADHEKAIVELNRAILAYRDDQKDAALESIKRAVGFSEDEMRQYLKYSRILADIAAWHPEIRNAIEQTSTQR